MATRNRTATFMKYRDALRQTRSDASTSMDESFGGSHATRAGGYIQLQSVENFRGRDAPVSLPPVWVDVSEKVKEDMEKLKAKMAELSKAHSRALLPNFGKETSHDENIELLTQEITLGLKRSEKSLQRLTRDTIPGENSTIARNVQRSMATDLQTLSLDFRKMQKGYLRRLQQQQEEPAGRGLTIKQSPPPEEDELYDPGFDDRQLLRVDHMAKVSVDREQEIKEIVSSVNDLAQIMKDLSVLVIDQGTIVDRIDYNIQNVGASIEKGMKQLEKAETTQKRTAMLYCIMLLVVMCLIMFVILVLKKLLF